MFFNRGNMINNMTPDQVMSKITLAQKNGDKKSEAIHRLILAKIHLENNNPDQALHEARQAGSIFRSRNNIIGDASTTLIQAQAALMKGQTGMAKNHYQNALNAYKRSGDQNGEALAHMGLAAVLFELNPINNINKVKNHLNQAIFTYQKLKDYKSMTDAKEILKAFEGQG